MLQIGNYHLHSLEVQQFSFEGSPLPAKTGANASGEPKPRIRLATRLLVIIGNGRHILVDAGVGSLCSQSRWSANATTPFRLHEELARIGLTAGDITDLVFTHLHSDHIGGAFTCVDNRLQLVFGNARIIVQEANFWTATHPDEKERVSYNPTIMDMLGHLPSFHTVSGTQELFPGIDVIISNGHTRGQQLIRVSDGRQTLLHGGDILPTAAHVPQHRVAGNDVDARTVIEEKGELLEQACEHGWILFFGHDPSRHAATVLRGERGFVPGPAPSF